jgi:queuine tRNA-ribosyltransferase
MMPGPEPEPVARAADPAPAFRIIATCPATRARCGVLSLAHAAVPTPVFMPVGTVGVVKTLTSQDVAGLGFSLVLANTYHLHVRPGDETIARLGGLHRFMSWHGAILTDSGGYQVFSLKGITRISEDGVAFASHLDGRRILLTPERAMAIQANLGSDVQMAFDECIPYPAEEAYVRLATDRSFRWTRRSQEEFRRRAGATAAGRSLFFGIVQGGMIERLRRDSARRVVDLEPDGLAIGGLSVGEPKELLAEVLDYIVPLLPRDRPRYLMGVGTPLDVARAVAQGVDMMDCVLPTRLGRHAHVYTSEGRLNLNNAAHRDDAGPLDRACACATCRGASRAYLHHLFRARELTGPRLATLHNLHYYATLMERIREAIPAGGLPDLIAGLERVHGAAACAPGGRA